MCVLSPLLFSLFTQDCMARNDSNAIIKFADEPTVVSLITDNYETAYREEVRDLAVWYQDTLSIVARPCCVHGHAPAGP